ncbi:hypothetical protein HDU91_000636 [Kappamyces sp. JEL0680]|nr:hypothetical protein HDU91_000636 [Kappamyces sp. JEL0680]
MADRETQVTDRIVLNYLAKRGFSGSQSLLRQEARIKDTSIPHPSVDDDADENLITNFVLFYNEDEVKNPHAYRESYTKLVKWVDDSIDIYKLELARILYPVYVHAFLDLIAKDIKDEARAFFDEFKGLHLEEHGLELQTLTRVSDAAHLRDNELAKNYRENKYGLLMSKYSFELLLCFLQDNKFMMILRLMNQHITIQGSRTG